MSRRQPEQNSPRAVDRGSLPSETEHKPSKWPRTDRRVSRLEATLSKRQRDLCIVLEDVHDQHNVSAVLRSCDATGIQQLHQIFLSEPPPHKGFTRRIAAGTINWVDVSTWSSVEECYGALQANGFRVLATALSDFACSIHDTDFTGPTAIVFGNEGRGLSRQAMALADGHIFIPMVGMVQSLNISVSCAVTLYEALRQRSAAGLYDISSFSEEELSAILERWMEY